MMTGDDLVEFAANQVADGHPVDWQALARQARSDEEREQLEGLRILGVIAALHRSSDILASVTRTRTVNQAAQSVTPDNRTGTPWGRYQLLEEVGGGSYGRVHRAWDPHLECEIAIKILHRHMTDVIPEGRTLAKVRDPNIVSVLGLETHGDQVGLCMEFVHGETLEKRLGAKGTFSAQEAMLVGQDVCRALVAVHRAGFVHRDVKAPNIMRARDGRIVLMDFGTGREVKQLERAKAEGLAGTALYMAPEVLASQPATPRSDVYSVGVLLYHLVTGRYPVEGKTLESIRAAHMLGTRTPVSEHNGHLPAAFISILDHALAANPQQRCSSAGELLEALATANSDVLGRSDRTRTIAVAAAKLAGALTAITAFGAVNSLYFNDALGRSEFVHERIVDWFGWGVSSLVAPTVLFMFALLALALLLAFRQFLLGASKRAKALENRLKANVRRWHLDDVGNLAACALIVSAAVLVGVWSHFRPLIDALIIEPNASTVPARELTLLAPSFQGLHETYRASFIWVTIICLMVWYPALRLAAKRREPVNRGLLAGGAAIVLLAILLLDFPYRMLSRNNEFETVNWNGARCYILGERQDDVLLFCPRLDPPRNRIISRRTEKLERLGVKESVFSPLSTNH